MREEEDAEEVHHPLYSSKIRIVDEKMAVIA
jgi:hypothetical protein